MNDYLNLDDILYAAGRYARHNCDEDVCSNIDVERNFAKDWRTHAAKTQRDINTLVRPAAWSKPAQAY